MNVQMQFVIQTVLLPLALSIGVKQFYTSKSQYLFAWLFAAWLIPYSWIIGVIPVLPKEAIEWPALLGLSFIAIHFVSKPSAFYTNVVNIAFVFSGIVILAWPVIVRTLQAQLIFELLFFTATAAIISSRLLKVQPASPALVLGISNAGLAVVSALGGSLIIGQVAGSLAAMLSVFALYELFKKLMSSQVDNKTILLIASLNLFLLVVARIYAEIPLVPTVLLAVSLIVGLTLKWRFAAGFSLLSVISSVSWILLTTDDTSYF